MLSGGIHLETFASCLVVTISTITLLALLLTPLVLNLSVNMILLLVFITHIFNMFLVILRIPVGNKNHEIRSSQKIKFFKKGSFVLVTVMTLICLALLIFINNNLVKIISISVIAGLNLQAITLLPFSYRLAEAFDKK